VTGTDLFLSIAAALDATGIPFMLTGSMAGAYHGAGRATMDIDLVVDPTREQLLTLVDRVRDAGLYISADAALEALEHRSMFNVVDVATGWKVDLIVRKTRPFSQAEFERRVAIDYAGRRVSVATLEDLIIAKLEWAKLSGSARQIEDVAALLKLREDELDLAYLERWIAALDLEPQWRQARSQGRGA